MSNRPWQQRWRTSCHDAQQTLRPLHRCVSPCIVRMPICTGLGRRARVAGLAAGIRTWTSPLVSSRVLALASIHGPRDDEASWCVSNGSAVPVPRLFRRPSSAPRVHPPLTRAEGGPSSPQLKTPLTTKYGSTSLRCSAPCRHRATSERPRNGREVMLLTMPSSSVAGIPVRTRPSQLVHQRPAHEPTRTPSHPRPEPTSSLRHLTTPREDGVVDPYRMCASQMLPSRCGGVQTHTRLLEAPGVATHDAGGRPRPGPCRQVDSLHPCMQQRGYACRRTRSRPMCRRRWFPVGVHVTCCQ